MASLPKQPKRSVLFAARLITALVSMAGIEGIAWFVGYPNWWAMDPTFGGASGGYECDANLGWRSREGDFKMVWADSPDTSHPFRYTNWSRGRRATSEQEPAPDAPNRPQVMFFGDSFIQGYGLSNPETLPWLVQQRHPELEVSNFGTGLYGTYQSYLSMQQWVRRPSHVYYLFNGFHEDRNAGSPSFLRVMKKPPDGCFYPYAQTSGGEMQGGRSPGELVWYLSRRLRTVALVQDYKLIIESYLRVRDKRKITEMLLVKMLEVVHTAGGEFTVILFDLEPEQRRDYRHFLEAQQIAFIDCDRPELKDRSLRLSDGHPNEKMNGLLAQWIEPVAAAPLQVISSNKPIAPVKTQ